MQRNRLVPKVKVSASILIEVWPECGSDKYSLAAT